MTMKQIPRTGEARTVLSAVASDVRKRDREVDEVVKQLEQEEKDVQIGTRATVLAIHEDLDVLLEERRQLRIAKGDPLPQETPANESAAASPPAARPAAPAPAPQAEPATPALGTPAAVPPRRQRRARHFVVQDWTAANWLLALILSLIGLVIGLIVARYTYRPISGGLHGAQRAAFDTFWWLGWGVLGFGIGGYLGHWWNNRSDSNSCRSNEE